MNGTHDKDAEDIIESMMSDMATDDGPHLPRNTRKRPNAADQFYEDNQEEYENKGQEQDRVSRARHHNSTYPKLHDELGRRRSITEVTTIDGRRLFADYDPNCSACAQIMTLKALRGKSLKYKCQMSESMQHDRRRDRQGDRRSRISKVKSNSHSHRSIDKTLSRVFTFSKTGSCKSIQCPSSSFVQHKKSGTNQSKGIVIHSKSRLSDSQCSGKNSRTSHKKCPSENFTNPGSRKASVSSYNSSINQEPMVPGS